MALTVLAAVVPPLIHGVLIIAFDGTVVSQWLNQYVEVVLAEVAIGGVILFRAWRPRHALLLLIVYVPLMVLLTHGVGLVVAGAVFNDYL